MKDLVIGVLGGMGTYATINLFKQYAEVFPAEKDCLLYTSDAADE